jgi:hypothetical protein
MKPPLKLNSIDQEHLQELYNASGLARDELPYTTQYDELWQGFQDRTFKNADREQVFGAIIKYVRSSSNAAGKAVANDLTDEQIKKLKSILSRHASGGKVLPYGDSFVSARTEFNKFTGLTLEELPFWQAILRAQGPKRQPPKRQKVAVAKVADDEDDGE